MCFYPQQFARFLGVLERGELFLSGCLSGNLAGALPKPSTMRGEVLVTGRSSNVQVHPLGSSRGIDDTYIQCYSCKPILIIRPSLLKVSIPTLSRGHENVGTRRMLEILRGIQLFAVPRGRLKVCDSWYLVDPVLSISTHGSRGPSEPCPSGQKLPAQRSMPLPLPCPHHVTRTA